MTAVLEQTTTPTPLPPRRTPGAWLAAWAPAPLALAALSAFVVSHGVSVRDLLAFVAYLALGITLPGALWWRAARRGSSTLAEDLAAGTTLGYALEVLTYLPARAAGVPLAVLAWPIATYLLFGLVPGLRRVWRMRPADRLPIWFSWVLTGLACYPAIWSAVPFYASHGLSYPASASPYVDLPYYLSLIGELKHHLPAQFPFEAGQPLTHHWFLHPEIAATSWVTGIEPMTLLFRLSILPMILALGVLLALLARRIIGAWWAGALTVAATWTLVGPALTGWAGGLSPGTSGLSLLWICPTQTFGAVLFAALMLTVHSLLNRTRDGRRWGEWAVFTVLCAVVMGAKGTFGALLLAGVGLATVLGFVLARRIDRTLLGLGAVTGVLFLVTRQLVYEGESFGLRTMFPAPSVINRMNAAGLTGDRPLWAYAVLGALILVGWLCLGGLILRLGRAGLADPVHGVLLGVGVAALLLVLVLAHPAASENYFVYSAWPYVCLLVVAGLAAVVRSREAAWWRYAVAVAGGALAAYLTVKLGPAHRPADGRLLALTLPYALAVLTAFAVAAGLAWRTGGGRRLLTSLLALGMLGFAVQSSVHIWRLPATPHPAQFIPAGALETGRWLRDHSTPDDLVATNAHCWPPVKTGCDSRHFWISAYAERRVLVESWGYTAWAHAAWIPFQLKPVRMPFHDQALLAANDAAFAQPTAASVGRLRDAYKVKWLFVDLTQNEPADGLDRVAILRYAAGSCRVYEIAAS
ncbi:hypothetical protein HDA40_005307 [Hamadaea flava]|uniref:4-amino-4-deoxy-L-arabinose transferase-like glycosyltransferase n=1 Tax=Hamadaea flava TaxID=1742688 RepID=A0ABV8M2H1_9ACTN|nr:hypothetical protein [Hamadaea flava]MCP2326800.1 hypothetical protein [Hamadaea flava]